MSAREMEKHEAISFAVVQELQKELEKQAHTIFQLRQDNVTLRCKLESEQETCQSYAEQIQQFEHEWCTPRRPLSTLARASVEHDRQTAMPTESLFPLTKNGVPLTIRTQPQRSDSERSWGDDVEVTSASDAERDVVCDETGERSECTMRRTPRQNCSLFFYKRKNKRSKGGRASFVHNPRPGAPLPAQQLQSSESTGWSGGSQVSTHSDEVASQTSARTQKAPQPVARKATEDACQDSLSRMGWADSDLGQKLVLIKESYSKNTDVFEDDVRFMREVLDGKSHAPEMDIEEELSNVMKDFKAWKKQFDESVRDLEVALKTKKTTTSTTTTTHTGHDEAIATGSVENKKEGAAGRSSMMSSIGKFLHRTIS